MQVSASDKYRPAWEVGTLRLRILMLGVVSLIALLEIFGQERGTIKGRILDGTAEKPISGVNVIVRGGKMGTMTDTAGYFRLELPTREKRVLVFSHIAYQKQIRIVSFDTTKEVEFRIHLIPDTIRFQEVVVTGKKQVTPSKAAERRAIYRLGGDEFERLGEEDMERALSYFLPFIVNRPEVRMRSSTADFTLYVNGEWKESITLSDVDPFRIRRVLVWDYLGVNKDIDLFPIGLPIHQGMYVILVETK
jgi:hypothetical protein